MQIAHVNGLGHPEDVPVGNLLPQPCRFNDSGDLLQMFWKANPAEFVELDYVKIK